MELLVAIFSIFFVIFVLWLIASLQKVEEEKIEKERAEEQARNQAYEDFQLKKKQKIEENKALFNKTLKAIEKRGYAQRARDDGKIIWVKNKVEDVLE